MSGLRLTLPTSFSDTSLPLLRDDPLLFSGSLALVDFTHLASPTVGLPASVPNIAHKEVAAVLGVADTGFPLSLSIGANLTGTRGKAERTTKGGLHAIISQNPGVLMNSNQGMLMNLPLEIRAYLYTNRAHDFYFSFWDRYTRAPNPSGIGLSFEFGSGSNSNKLMHYRSDTGFTTNAAPQPTQEKEATPSAIGHKFANVSFNGAGTNLTTTPTISGSVWGPHAGTFSNAVSSWLQGLPSHILYRMYLEDLTVSGRSYAQVDAIDQAEYDKEVLTAGGRYYGDTFTDPATIP